MGRRTKQLSVSLASFLSCCATTSKVSPDPVESVHFKYPNTVDLGDIEVDSLSETTVHLMQVISQGEKRVTLRIDSSGGGVAVGNRWVRYVEDLKKKHNLHVACIVDGIAASMAAVILQTSFCDERLATSRSIILFHNGYATQASSLSGSVLLEALNQSMALSVALRLGVSVQDYAEKIAGGDWALSVLEARKWNVIDGIASPADIAPPKEG